VKKHKQIKLEKALSFTHAHHIDNIIYGYYQRVGKSFEMNVLDLCFDFEDNLISALPVFELRDGLELYEET
jgi:hypothetical protein